MAQPSIGRSSDPLAAYPAAATARAALTARDWPAFRAQFLALDWGYRSITIRDLDSSGGLEDYLRGLVAQDPTDVLPATILASVLIETGWGIRSAYRAKNVSQEQFRQFHDYLRRAEVVLVDVIARDPSMVTAWEVRMMSVRGLELGLSEGRRRYDQLSRYQPNHLPAQRQYLQHACPKWAGTFDKVHAFGRECMLGAPDGSLSASMVAEGHLEHWMELDSPADNAYIRTPAVGAELREAAHRSIFHPAYQPAPGWVRAISSFAMAFSLTGDLPAAAACFRMLGPYTTDWPWSFLKGGAAAAFADYRQRAYAATGAGQ